jgi:hypothetical protein
MKKLMILMAITLSWALPLNAAQVRILDQVSGDGLEVDVWLNRSDGDVYHRGDAVRVNFRSNVDCYVALYNVDVDGYLHLLYPRYDDPQWVYGERIYSVPGPSDDYELVVDGPKGIEYVVAVASAYPLHLDVLDPVGSNGYRAATYTGRITGDPSQAIWQLNEELAWNGAIDGPEGYTSDVSYFYVRSVVPYPRFLVYDYYRDHYWDRHWDPYHSSFLWIDFHWDHGWCGSNWWWRGHRPVHVYWFREHHEGPRIRWKSHVQHDSASHRTKPPRATDRRERPSRADGIDDPRRSGKPVREITRSPSGSRGDGVRTPSAGVRIERERKPRAVEDRPRYRDERKPERKPAPPRVKPPSKPKTEPRRTEVKPPPKPEPKPERTPERRSEDKPKSKPKSKPKPKPERRDRSR